MALRRKHREKLQDGLLILFLQQFYLKYQQQHLPAIKGVRQSQNQVRRIPSPPLLLSHLRFSDSARVGSNGRTDGHPAEREAATQSTYSSISHLVRRRRLLSSPKKGFAEEQVGLLLDLILHNKLCIVTILEGGEFV